MHAIARRTIAVVLLAAAIIVPFLIWGEKLDALVPELVDSKIAKPILGAIVALLLASDIVLPIPSSIVAFLSGQLLSFVPGTIANFAHLAQFSVADRVTRIDEIIQAINVLVYNPLIGRPVGESMNELVIGRDAHGYVALYRYVAAVDSVFVLAIRSQREGGYSRE